MKNSVIRPQAIKHWIVMMLLLLTTGLAQAQAEMSETNESDKIAPFFYLDMANFRGEKPNESRLEIYLKIMYDDLQFVKLAPDSFRAAYEMSVVVLDEDDFQVNGKIWRDSIFVKDFETTNSRQLFHTDQASFVLAPGKYRVNVGLMDADTRRTGTRKTTIIMRNFDDAKLAVSDVLIADAVSVDSSGKLLPRPQVTAPRQEKSQLFAFLEIYDKGSDKEYKVSYVLKNPKGDKVFKNEAVVRHTGQITPVVLELPNATLAHGVYQIHIEVKGSKQTTTTEREITLHWVGIPTNIVDLDQAIEQMRYIAKKEGMKKIMAVPPEKRREAFLKFWQENDPTPGTETNELMDEYYTRVNYANAHFRSMREGWRTDMGMVYIVFGPPSDIERNPFTRSTGTLFAGRTVKAYEIWNYYNINRQFIFVDETGYAEYRLAYPLSIDQYIR
jgi:GWxTD domain-containing protein